MEGAVVPGSNSRFEQSARSYKAAEECCGVQLQAQLQLALGRSASRIKASWREELYTMRGIMEFEAAAYDARRRYRSCGLKFDQRVTAA